MKMISRIALLGFLPALSLVSCSDQAAEDQTVVLLPAVASDDFLRDSINAERQAQGKSQLVRSARLDAAALRECQRVAQSGELVVNLTNIQKSLGKKELVGALLGRLKDRGPETGGKYVSHWIEGPNNRAMLLGDWSSFGAATVRSADGDMVAVVILAP